MILFNKLRNRLLVVNMSIITVLMLTAFLVIYWMAYNDYQRDNRNRLRVLSAAPVGQGISLPPNWTPGEMEREDLVIGAIPRDFTPSFSLQVDQQGELLNVRSFIDMPETAYQEAARLAWQGQGGVTSINLEGRRWMYQISPMSETRTMLRDRGRTPALSAESNRFRITFMDVTEAREALNGLLTSFMMVGAGMLILIFLVSYYFANRAIRPIAAAWERQKRFVADASHELKTPIAVIAANSEALLANSGDTVDNQRKWIDRILGESEGMSKLVSNLLFLARTDDSVDAIKRTPFDLCALAEEKILAMEAVAFERGIEVTRRLQPELFVKSDRERLGQVVTILLDNAIKYTNEGGSIEIDTQRNRHQAALRVKNSGLGINKEDLPKVFDRFYRGDPARVRETGGYGLGLSIAKATVEQLGGEISAASVENQHTTFTVTL